MLINDIASQNIICQALTTQIWIEMETQFTDGA